MLTGFVREANLYKGLEATNQPLDRLIRPKGPGKHADWDTHPEGTLWGSEAKGVCREPIDHLAKDLVPGRTDERFGQRGFSRDRGVSKVRR